MNTSTTACSYSAQQLNRLHDQARIEAAALRREAIDAFWHATWQWLALPHRGTSSVGARLHIAN